ncbi:MAG: O-antigen ligase family protein [bacterium]
MAKLDEIFRRIDRWEEGPFFWPAAAVASALIYAAMLGVPGKLPTIGVIFLATVVSFSPMLGLTSMLPAAINANKVLVELPLGSFRLHWLVSILLIAQIAMREFTESRKIRRTPLDIPVAAFGGVILLSFLYTIDCRNSLRVAASIVSFILMYYVVFYTLGSSPRRFKGLMVFLLASAAIFGVRDIARYISTTPQEEWIRLDNLLRLGGDNLRVVFPLGALPIAAALIPLAKDIPSRVGALILCLILLGGIFGSLAMSGFVVSMALLTIYIPFLAYISAKTKRGKIWTAIAFTGILAVISPLLMAQVLSLSKFTTFVRRTELYEGALAKMGENLFWGTGIGSENIFFSESAGRALVSHNNFLQVASELGILGLTAFVWIIVRGLRSVLPEVRGHIPPDYIRIGILFGVLGFLLHGMAENTLHSPLTNWFLGLLLAMASQFSPRRGVGGGDEAIGSDAGL